MSCCSSSRAQLHAGPPVPSYGSEGGRAQAAQAEHAGIAVGSVVEAHGLVGTPQHNGKIGTVTSYNKGKAQYIVLLEGADGKQLSLRPSNLRPAGSQHEVGSVVEIHGLVSTKQHNRKIGTVASYNENSGQYIVLLAGADGKQLSLRPSNLRPAGYTHEVGSVVEVHGLVSMPQHNSKIGTVASYNESNGQYIIVVAGEEGKKLSLRPANMRPQRAARAETDISAMDEATALAAEIADIEALMKEVGADPERAMLLFAPDATAAGVESTANLPARTNKSEAQLPVRLGGMSAPQQAAEEKFKRSDPLTGRI